MINLGDLRFHAQQTSDFIARYRVCYAALASINVQRLKFAQAATMKSTNIIYFPSNLPGLFLYWTINNVMV